MNPTSGRVTDRQTDGPRGYPTEMRKTKKKIMSDFKLGSEELHIYETTGDEGRKKEEKAKKMMSEFACDSSKIKRGQEDTK